MRCAVAGTWMRTSLTDPIIAETVEWSCPGRTWTSRSKSLFTSFSSRTKSHTKIYYVTVSFNFNKHCPFYLYIQVRLVNRFGLWFLMLCVLVVIMSLKKLLLKTRVHSNESNKYSEDYSEIICICFKVKTFFVKIGFLIF